MSNVAEKARGLPRAVQRLILRINTCPTSKRGSLGRATSVRGAMRNSLAGASG